MFLDSSVRIEERIEQLHIHTCDLLTMRKPRYGDVYLTDRMQV